MIHIFNWICTIVIIFVQLPVEIGGALLLVQIGVNVWYWRALFKSYK